MSPAALLRVLPRLWDNLPIWDQAAELGCLDLHILGGEPLLHPQVVQITRHIHDCHMTTGVTTNGFLLTMPGLESLIDAGHRI